MASVTVQGVASASVTPDRAVVTLAITHLAPDAATALDETAQRSRALESILQRHGLGRDDWATEGVTVGEEYQWKNDSNVLTGYRANTAVAVTVGSVDLVGRLIRDSVTEAGANVRNLLWTVDIDNPARTALLGDAARDARRRAGAYVGALGLALGEVESVSEIQPERDSDRPQGRPMMAAKLGADVAEPAIGAGLVTLTAAVYVTFGILPMPPSRG